MTHLYVCHFSNGHIKVGRSIDPKSRIASHVARVACIGVELVDSAEYLCAGSVVMAEASLIGRCASSAVKRNQNEWFEGLYFSDVCDWAKDAALRDFKTVQAPRTQVEIPKEMLDWLEKSRYRFIGGDPGQRWLDKTPNRPHWPESDVMRWDLRRTDWHQIWPELIDHPCALLFAPIHPDRVGPPKFTDWTRSWPEGYLPSRDDPVANTFLLGVFANGVYAPWDLRPDDWHLIWPELIGAEGAPAIPQPEAKAA